jgi:hypothetical protein
MAETTRTATYAAGTAATVVPSAALRRISWGAVLAGVAIVIAVQISLSVLGLGVGLSTIDLRAGDTPQVGSFGLGAGLWWLISNLIALIIGGYVAARLSGMPLRGDGILHGLLTWAVTLVITIYLLTTGVGGMVGGAFHVVGNTLSSVGQGVAQAVPQAANAAGASADQIKQGAQELLRPQQPRALSPDQAQNELVAALGQMATGSQQEAQQARQRAVEIVAQQAGISPEEANQRIDRLQTEARQKADQAKAKATEAADSAASAASSASIWAFIAFVLGAAAGAWGGSMGTRNRVEYAS